MASSHSPCFKDKYLAQKEKDMLPQETLRDEMRGKMDHHPNAVILTGLGTEKNPNTHSNHCMSFF